VRTKVTLILIFLNVALFFFIFRFERAWRTEAALQEARRRVLGAETAEIRGLSVTSSVAGGPSYELVRNRDVWMLTKPLDWPANQHAVRSIIHELQFLQNETSFSVADLAKNNMSLADYGLDKPKVTVAFTSSEGSAPTASGEAAAAPTTVLKIGDTTNVGNRLYVLSPDGTRIHVVNRSLIDALSIPIDELRADTLFTIQVFEAKALSLQTSGVRVRIAKREGTRWMFDTIVNARAGKTQMELTINALNSLHAKSFPSKAPSVLPSASPTLRVTIDGNNRSETLFLGEPVKGGTSISSASNPEKGETEYFAQLMNGNIVRAPVFTVVVPNGLIEELRNAQTALRDRRVIDFDPAAVTSITLAAPGLQPVTLQRLDANAPDGPWQVVRGGAGSAGVQTGPADAASVHRLLERLALLSATGFESDAPSSAQTESWGFNRPEREITLAVSGSPAAATRSIQLQLGTDSAGAVYARVGAPNEPGPSVYAVKVDLAQDFPVDPMAWRNRTLRELPATAHITGLKLTDLSTHQVVFETKLDASGKPAGDVRDPAALHSLLTGLRTLRAKRFLRDGFADKVMVAGDERTWRYQLDAAISLPASGTEEASTSTSTLFLTERVGGAQQLAGSREFDVVFELEQPVLDALWSLTYGPRDPGPQLEKQ
jgi:hypothetical protein